MSREPTAPEIRETNANISTRCDSCDLVVAADTNYCTFPNMLNFTVDGGYGEYADTIYPDSAGLRFTLCHKCGHKLMTKFFPHYDFSRWHPKTEDKYCNGWTFDDAMEILKNYAIDR